MRRVLLTFSRIGFAEQRDRRFRLTSKVMRPGYGYLSSSPWWEHAEPHMRSLSNSTQDSSSLATLDGTEIVYLARVPSPRSVSITLNIGSRLPAYPTSLGRVLLAALPDDELDAYFEQAELVALTSRTITDPSGERHAPTTTRLTPLRWHAGGAPDSGASGVGTACPSCVLLIQGAGRVCQQRFVLAEKWPISAGVRR